MMSCEHDE
jgi:hypothetical protein